MERRRRLPQFPAILDALGAIKSCGSPQRLVFILWNPQIGCFVVRFSCYIPNGSINGEGSVTVGKRRFSLRIEDSIG